MNNSSSRCSILVLTACLSTPLLAQGELPEAVRVPAGHSLMLETVGKGTIVYECRDKQDMPGQTEWFFVGPKADLHDRQGKLVGTYFGPPATWQAKDGSKVVGKQLAVAPAGAGNLPYQLVEAAPAEGQGAFQGTRYIQRTALKGGVAPAKACTSANKGERETVTYQADYLFWKKG